MIFTEFPKLARLSRGCVITEKIDGTNAQVFIRELPDTEVMPTDTPIVAVVGKSLLYAGSRTRWITPEDDNFGFARWVKENAEELAKLGPGNHFGEWWGCGIQRTYGLKEKRFSLFNTARWKDEIRPACCHVVPMISAGLFTDDAVQNALTVLREKGSFAAPGFMRPEGIVVYHSASRTMFKKTLEKDHEPKSLASRLLTVTNGS